MPRCPLRRGQPLPRREPDALADSFVAELGERCGIIKAGASYHHLTPFEERAFEAAAAVALSNTEQRWVEVTP